ncbi:MAG: restriction endonuclease subunit S, partial [Acidithiobacillus sp.]|nr:restriction endonuclease subunit S [Acidithiobacillus sp.]
LFSGTDRDQWTQLKLNDLCVYITSGGTPSRRVPTYYIDGVYSWVKTQELCDTWINNTEEHITPEAIAQSSAKILPKNTVLVAMYGATVGKLGLLRQPMTCNQACCALIVDDQKADYRFIFYQLLQDRDRLRNLATGAAQQNLSGEVIRSLKFWIPPLPEQRRIAHILGTLDDKIENNRKTAKTLEAMAQAIFHSWFVDFDPVRAKMAGESPESICKRLKLTPEILDLFPDRLVDSELGEIPEGWRVGIISELADISSGKRPENRFEHQSDDAKIPLWGGNGPIGFVCGTLIDGPSILTGRVGTLGTFFRIDSPCWPSDNTLIIRPKNENGFEFLFLSLLQLDIISLNRGSTQPLLTQSDLNNQLVIKPKFDIITAFHSAAKLLYNCSNNCTNKSDKFANIRDIFLPKLISGEIRVPDAEHLLEEATR